MKRLDVGGIGPYAVVLLVSCFLFYQTLEIAPGNDGHPGGDFWPKTILIFAIFTCVWEIARRLFAPRGERSDALGAAAALIPKKAHADATTEVGPVVPWVGIALTAAYVFTFEWLGYFVATVLYVTAFVYLGNYRRPVVAVCVGFVASLAFMFLFMRIVYVSLPIGAGPFAALSTLLMRIMGIK